MDEVNILASGKGVITCSKDSAAYNYAVSKGIATNVVPSEELNVKKPSATVTLLSDNSYLFDVTDSYNMKGILYIELYDGNGELTAKKTREADDVEYRVEFTEEEMKNVSFSKIYIADESGVLVSTEDEVISVDGGEIPTIPESDIELKYDNGVVTLSGTSLIKQGTILAEAIYNSDNSLKSVKLYHVTSISEPIAVDTGFEKGKAKFMLWESMASMKPMAEAIIE
jgi:hypothetical protein